MRGLLRDLRYSARGLRRTPGFSALVLLTIGIGTGVNATVFGFIDALLFRAVPGIAEPSRLVAIFTANFTGGPYGPSSLADLESLREETSSFDAIGGAQDDPLATLTSEIGIERSRVASVTDGYFDALGATPVVGRLITAAEMGRIEDEGLAVVSEDFWTRRFNRADDVLGRRILINGRRYRVIGVAPRGFGGFELGRPVDVWLPLVTSTEVVAQRGNRMLAIVARLKPGRSLDDARHDVAAVGASLADRFPATNRGLAIETDAPKAMTALPVSRLDPTYRSRILLLAAVVVGATGLVLLICCANVATLLLSRAASRAREVAVRLALGASRAELVRALVADGLLIGAGGTAIGVLFANWTMHALPAMFAPEWARILDARIDAAGWLIAIGLAMTASIIASLAPIGLARRVEAIAALRGDGGAGSDARSNRVREWLVTLQVALACVLLVSTGLLSQSLASAFRTDAGDAARTVLTASAVLDRMTLQWKGVRYYRDGLERVRGIAGVEAAAWTSTLPLQDAGRREFSIEGYVPAPAENVRVSIITVTLDYFETMRLTRLSGRLFTKDDRWSSKPVVVINEVMARRYFQGNPLGRHLTDAKGPIAEVVGVVEAEKYRTLQDAPLAAVYYPLEQHYLERMAIVARFKAPTEQSLRELDVMLGDARVNVSHPPARPLEPVLSALLAPERLTTTLVSACGALAIALAMIGLYGVTAYAVFRRRREIGVRVALGARPAGIARLVLAAGMRLTIVGSAIGIVGAAIMVPLLAAVVHGAEGPPLIGFVLVPLALIATAVVASIVPILRALRVQPIVALRTE